MCHEPGKQFVCLQGSVRFAREAVFGRDVQVWSQPGNGHYAAANAMVDGWAATARASGLPATNVQFGAFKGAGMAANHVQQLAAIGMQPLEPSQAFTAPTAVGYAGELIVANLDKGRFKQVSAAPPMSMVVPGRTLLPVLLT